MKRIRRLMRLPFCGKHPEVGEVGKVAVGAGVGGLLGWVATMASISGSGAHYKVWTPWSALLVVVSAAVLLVGAIAWVFFRRRGEPRQELHFHEGSNPQVFIGFPPGIVNASTSDTMTVVSSGPRSSEEPEP